MRKPAGRILRRSAAALLVSGVGTITLDQGMSAFPTRSEGDALAGDWQAVGDDLRRAMRKAARVRHVA